MEHRSHHTVTAILDGAPYTTRISADGHDLLADEPADLGGSDLGPRPHDLLCASLAACTAITLRMYAARKGWPHEAIRVTAELDRLSANGKVESRFTLKVGLPEGLDDHQRARMLQIATHCPVHRTLENPIHLNAELA